MKLLIVTVCIIASGLLFDNVSGDCNCVQCDSGVAANQRCAAKYDGNKMT